MKKRIVLILLCLFPLLSACSTQQEYSQEQSIQTDTPKKTGPASFTKKEMTYHFHGWIRYGHLDYLGRATEANALITKSMIGTGTSANQELRPKGFISGQQGHSRGHLIGKQLGGSGETIKNLVTLYQNPVNTPYMTKYENEVREVVEQGNPVRYRVTPVYTKGQLMPKQIIMEARTIKNQRLNYKVVINNER